MGTGVDLAFAFEQGYAGELVLQPERFVALQLLLQFRQAVHLFVQRVGIVERLGELLGVLSQSLLYLFELSLAVLVLRQEPLQKPQPAAFVLGQFVDLVLPVDVELGQQVTRRERGDLTVCIAHDRRLAHAARHRVALAVLRERGNLHLHPPHVLAQVLLDDLVVLLSGLRAFGQHVQCKAQALDQGRLAGSPAANHRVQVAGQHGFHAVEVAAADLDAVDGARLVFWLLGVQPHPRLRV